MNISSQSVSIARSGLAEYTPKKVSSAESIPIVVGKILFVAITVGLIASAAYSILGLGLAAESSYVLASVLGIGGGLGFTAAILPFSKSMYRYTELNGEDCTNFCIRAAKTAMMAIGVFAIASVGYASVLLTE